MTRRNNLIFAAVAIFVICSIWLGRHSIQKLRPTYVDYGSGFISKGLQAEDKVLVMAKMESEDVNWVAEELPDWQHAIYHMDEPEWVLHPPINKGREAMAYLTFIISHYSSLPEIIVFIHPHRRGWPAAWHTDALDYDNANSIRSLRLDYVRQHGYANMRCIHEPGCPDEVQPFRNDTERHHELIFADAYVSLLGGNYSTVPRVIGTPCCSQFAVSRDQVLQRPLSDYVSYRKWLIETSADDATSGRVFEYLWHIIFGRDPVHCLDMPTCWCEQFGRCF